MIDRPATPRPALREPGDRLGHAIGAHLRVASEDLPAAVTERLRFAREQALLKARSARAAQSELAPSTQLVRNGASLALFGGKGSPRWLKFASLMPLFMLVLGLALIQHGQFYEQILAAAEVDTALLADNLPPSAYSDPGFSEFLSDEQD